MRNIILLILIVCLIVFHLTIIPTTAKKSIFLTAQNKQLPPSKATLDLIEKAGIAKRPPYKRMPYEQRKQNKNRNHAAPFTIVPVASGANLQTAITAAACGDILELEAGATWDGSFSYNHNCAAGNEITIRSANYALLPNGVIGTTQSDSNAHSANMARIRTIATGTTYGSALRSEAGAGGLILDGIEVTDNAASTTFIATLLDFGLSNQFHDLTIKRCWIHQKETGSNYNRIVQRAVWFEGEDFLMKWSYVFLLGYYNPDSVGGQTFLQMDTTAFLCTSVGDDITLTENFLDTWWNIWFLGGSDSAGLNTASLTGATTTSATFSSISGIGLNTILRLSITGAGTWDNGNKTLTQTSGITLDSGDGGRALSNQHDSGTAIVFTPSGGGASSTNCKLDAPISGSSVPIGGNNTSVGASGTYDWAVYQSARVTNIAGSVITYAPFGIDQIRHAGAVTAVWNTGDQGLITDVAFTKNNVYLDPTFAEDVYLHKGYCNKGIWETKNVNRELIEGNYFHGMPSQITWTAANQNGSSPWIKVDNVTIRNNYANFDTGHTNCVRFFIMYTDDGYLNTIGMTDGVTTLSNTITVTNNLVINQRSFMDTKFAKDYLIQHNTSINNQATAVGVNAIVSNQTGPVPNFVFKDNIGFHVCYGFQGYPTAYPSSTILKNVLIDSPACSGGINANTYGTGSILTPIIDDISEVGFVNVSLNNYRLASNSDFKNDASDGNDPGVDYVALVAALGFDPSSSAVCNWYTNPACQ